MLHCLGLAGFVIIAMASSSTKSVVNDPDFREGFRQGWEYSTGQSDATDQILPLEIDSICSDQPLVATNN